MRLIRPVKVWVLIDMDNGDDGSKRYLWWFPTRARARKYKAWQNRSSKRAFLVGPFRYDLHPAEPSRPLPNPNRKAEKAKKA